MPTFRQQALRDWGGTQVHPVSIECSISPEQQEAVLDVMQKAVRRTYPKACYSFYREDSIYDLELPAQTVCGRSRKQRIDRNLYDWYGHTKLNAEEEKEMSVLLSQIGAESNHPTETLNVHLSRRIWWLNGSFGDYDSCYWAYHADHRDYLNEHPKDFMALTIYWPNGNKGNNVKRDWNVATSLRLNDDLRGYGRALIFIDDARQDAFCVSNTYGIHQKKVARLLEAMFPTHQYVAEKMLELGTHKRVWINNGGFTFWPKDTDAPKCIRPDF